MWAEYAKEDGADGVLLLPPTLYRSTDDGIVEHFRKVAEVGLPIMAYNNPFDTKVDITPQLVARLAEIPEVVAIKEFSGDVRRVFEIKELCDIDVIAGADDVLFEMLVDGAVGWFAGYPNAFPKEAVELYDLCVSGKWQEARALYEHLVAVFRWDSRTEFVQAIKLSMDICGNSYGGPTRPPRTPLTPSSTPRSPRTPNAHWPPWQRADPTAIQEVRHMRSSLVFHAVDSHTEGMPTRVITGGVGVIPGATMNDRRLHFIAHLDHIRRLLMNEPRGHSSMSGAILQPPSRPDCDYGVVYIEASGCLPMCGHGTMGVATVLVETGMVEVTEPRTIIRLDTPAGLVVADVEVRDGRRRFGHPGECCRASPNASTPPSASRGSARCRTRSRSVGTSTRWSTSTTSVCRSTVPAPTTSSPRACRS